MHSGMYTLKPYMARMHLLRKLYFGFETGDQNKPWDSMQHVLSILELGSKVLREGRSDSRFVIPVGPVSLALLC